jgi:hypothetical protein
MERQDESINKTGKQSNKYWKKAIKWMTRFLSAILIGLAVLYLWQWINKPDIKLGASIYAYEKGFILHNQTKTYYIEMRNLANNCSFYRFQVPLPRGRAEIPEPGAWILLKLRLENTSPVSLTNLRLGVRAFGQNILDTLSCTPNIEASMSKEFNTKESLSTYVVEIESLSSDDKAIVTLKGSIDKKTYIDITSKPKYTVVFPFIVSDQFKAINLKDIKFNASEMLKDECEMFTGERTTVNEKVEFRLLKPEEPSIVEEEIHRDPLPPAKKCPEGTAGIW